MRRPAEIATSFIKIGENKASLPAIKMLILGIFAGMFVALAGAGSSIAATTVSNPSLSRLCNAMIFPAGLVMVLLAGSELFTGNSLMVISVLEKKINLKGLLKNWVVVYIGNLLGSMFVAVLFVFSHVPGMFDGKLAEFMVASAAAKTHLTFSDAFLRAILCNILVCLAVWVAASVIHAEGKIIALYLPIVVFVLCGFEHCVANMFCIPAGIFAAGEYGVVAEGLNWFGFFVKNLIPVTLGNIVGGSMVGIGYWFVYLQGKTSDK